MSSSVTWLDFVGEIRYVYCKVMLLDNLGRICHEDVIDYGGEFFGDVV